MPLESTELGEEHVPVRDEPQALPPRARASRASREIRRRVSREFENLLDVAAKTDAAHDRTRRSSHEAQSGAIEKHLAELEQAAITVQCVWRGRKRRAILSRWQQAVAELRTTYMDDRALKAGANSNPLYSDAALAARDALRTTTEVERALAAAWAACRACVGHADATGLTHDEYKTMTRKIYLVIKLKETDAELDVADVETAAEEDWAADSQGQSEISEESFKRCWFELADGKPHAAAAQAALLPSIAIDTRVCDPCPPSHAPCARVACACVCVSAFVCSQHPEHLVGRVRKLRGRRGAPRDVHQRGERDRVAHRRGAARFDSRRRGLRTPPLEGEEEVEASVLHVAGGV